MGAFDLLSIAGSSMGAHQTWMDALADNIANVNTYTKTSESAYQAKYVVTAAKPGGGVEVTGIVGSDPNGRVVNDPDSPLADADGNVRAPDIDMADQMSELVMAQRGFQASVQVTKDAQETYQSALSIGKS